MATLLDEIIKTLGGSFNKSDVYRFQDAAVAGGRSALGLSRPYVEEQDWQGPPVLPPEPYKDSDWQGPQQEEFGVPAMLKDHLRAPITFDEIDVPPMLAATGPLSASFRPTRVPPASRAKASSPASQETRQQVQAASQPVSEDQLLADYRDKGSKLERERADALSRAAAEKNLTDDEKVAMALLAALPGLLGAIGGGAIAGGVGAASGAAGGLQGGAQGAQMIAQGKNERRKEALGQAEQLAGRLDKNDVMVAGRKGELDQRAFTTTQSEKDRAFHAAENEKSRKAHAAEAAATRDAHHRDILTQGAITERQHRIDAEADLARVRMKAEAESGGKLKEEDKSFYANAAGLLRNIKELKQLVGKVGNYESDASFSIFSDSKAAGKLNQLLYDSAVAYAKIVDPATAAREGEVEMSKKYAIPAGLSVSQDATMEALDHMEKMVGERARTRSQLGTPLSPEAAQQIQRNDQRTPRASAPYGLRVRQDGADFEWDGSKYVQVK